MTGTLQGGGFFKFLISLSICCTCLFINAQAIDQPGETITLKADNIPLYEVFKTIFKQTKFKVSYANSILDDKQRVNVNFNKTTITEAMNILLKDKDTQWMVNDRVIIIAPRKEIEAIKKNYADSSITSTVLNGKITDASGTPLIGATVQVKGTNNGTITDAEGNFALSNVRNNSTLLISSVGYETREMTVRGRSILAQLTMVIGELDETVVIAYGTTTRRYSTGNVVSIKAKEIEKQPVGNPLLALQGRVPGLVIEQSTGISGSGVTVRIQGQNSISKGNDPLYVVDGVPYVSQLLPSISTVLGSSGAQDQDFNVLMGNPLSFINPADIESIDILKDADATAIYGSRAANGAILITTKKGKGGETKVDVSLQTGWGSVTRRLNVLNTSQYLEMRHEAKKNDGAQVSSTDYDINGAWDTTRYTDWQKELIGGTANYTNAQVTVSGGTLATNFLLSGNYRRESSVFPGDFSDQKASMHLNVNTASSNQKFLATFSANYMFDNNELPTADLTNTAVRLAPNAPALYDVNGEVNWQPLSNGNSTWTNPLAYLYSEYSSKTTNLISNSMVRYVPFPGLELKANLGYTSLQVKEVATYPMLMQLPEIRFIGNSLRSSQFGDNSINSWTLEPQLTYNKSFDKSKVEFLLGSTLTQYNFNGRRLNATGYSSDLLLKDISSAANIMPSRSTISTYKYNAIFSRINYILKDKYIASLNARRDGSSRFGSENVFHNFGSIALAWIFSNEGLIQKYFSGISFGKLKVSYGTTGNDQIGDYLFADTYSAPFFVNPYQGVTGLVPDRLNNPYLQWEETRKLQLGIDLGFLKDRILFNANYYHNRSSNQLQSYALPITTGFSNISSNFPATVENTGWELSLNTVNLKIKKFSWTSGFNLTIPKNKLVSYPDIDLSSAAYSLEVGQPITIVKVFHMLGVNPITGVYQFSDSHGNTTDFPNFATDQTVVINTAPKFYGGFQNTFSYKGFSIDMLFQFVNQVAKNYFFGDRPGNFFGTSNIANQPATIAQRWRQEGDNAPIQRYSSDFSLFLQSSYAQNFSDAAYSSASYIRLKNFSLSWLLPDHITKKIRLVNTRLYLQCQNLFTITNYLGMDPETKSSTTLPPLRIVTLGVQVML